MDPLATRLGLGGPAGEGVPSLSDSILTTLVCSEERIPFDRMKTSQILDRKRRWAENLGSPVFASKAWRLRENESDATLAPSIPAILETLQRGCTSGLGKESGAWTAVGSFSLQYHRRLLGH